MAKKPTVKVQSAPDEQPVHPLICPFSGKPMEIRMVGADVHFMIVSPHGFTSKLMRTRDECMEWAGTRFGKMTYTAPKIEVKTSEEPDLSAQDGIREIAPDPYSIDDRDLPPSMR